MNQNIDEINNDEVLNALWGSILVLKRYASNENSIEYALVEYLHSCLYNHSDEMKKYVTNYLEKYNGS